MATDEDVSASWELSSHGPTTGKYKGIKIVSIASLYDHNWQIQV